MKHIPPAITENSFNCPYCGTLARQDWYSLLADKLAGREDSMEAELLQLAREAVADGELLIFDGVTRATRAAQVRPGDSVRVEVIGDLSVPCSHLPTIGDQLP